MNIYHYSKVKEADLLKAQVLWQKSLIGEMLMGKTMSVLSEIKVVVAAVMLLVLWPCSRLVYLSCQMEV